MGETEASILLAGTLNTRSAQGQRKGSRAAQAVSDSPREGDSWLGEEPGQRWIATRREAALV